MTSMTFDRNKGEFIVYWKRNGIVWSESCVEVFTLMYLNFLTMKHIEAVLVTRLRNKLIEFWSWKNKLHPFLDVDLQRDNLYKVWLGRRQDLLDMSRNMTKIQAMFTLVWIGGYCASRRRYDGIDGGSWRHWAQHSFASTSPSAPPWSLEPGPRELVAAALSLSLARGVNMYRSSRARARWVRCPYAFCNGTCRLIRRQYAIV